MDQSIDRRHVIFFLLFFFSLSFFSPRLTGNGGGKGPSPEEVREVDMSRAGSQAHGHFAKTIFDT